MSSYTPTVHLIDGQWVASASGKTIPVVNPATGERSGTVAHAEKPELDQALAAAQKGFETWRKVSAFGRSKIMRKAADLLRSRADAIARSMTLDQGKPLPEAKSETMSGADVIDWFAEEARRAYGRVILARAPGVCQLAVKEPVGPVAAFTLLNFPINQVVRKVSAALATSCSIIVRPGSNRSGVNHGEGKYKDRCIVTPSEIMNAIGSSHMPGFVTIPLPIVVSLRYSIVGGNQSVARYISGLALPATA